MSTDRILYADRNFAVVTKLVGEVCESLSGAENPYADGKRYISLPDSLKPVIENFMGQKTSASWSAQKTECCHHPHSTKRTVQRAEHWSGRYGRLPWSCRSVASKAGSQATGSYRTGDSF